MNSIVTITKSAGKKLIEMTKTHNTPNILFYVKGGGCNGFGYKFKPLYEKPDLIDEVVPYKDINIIVCGKSMMYLIGTTIDWKNDIMGESFTFENPNAGAKCGCGTSFSMKV
tara:strand:+ start:717 stop:1052 length:336 start_codon:yes stop_codon:yes gene_type:complete